MSINNKIRGLMNITEKKTEDLAKGLGISVQAVRNKLSRDTFSAEDLIKISACLGCELSISIDANQKVVLDESDLRK